MTLFGYGKTTSAIAKRFGNCLIFDDNFKEIQEFGTNKLMPMSSFCNTSDLVIPSPGIAPHHYKLKTCTNIISEYDLFADEMPFSIWISGTNGKTTTTQMLTFLLEKKGAICGGNIGAPLADLDKTAPIWVLETSSFTLHYTKKAKPNIYILLPITPDHISWHESFSAYEASKLKPILTLQEGEMAIVPKKYAATPTNGTLVPYENSLDLAQFFGIDIAKIRFKEPFLQDCLLALGVTKALFNEIDYDLLNSFELSSHKLEELKDSKQRLWVNDSKATNLDATIAALNCYKNKQIHLILGGDDKGVDLGVLFEFLKTINVSVYAIGSNANKIFEVCERLNIKVNLCGFLDIAVAKIAQNLDKNAVALLSPAAASLDQFSSYEQRGNEFKSLVSAI